MLVLQKLLGGNIRHKAENHAYVLTISSLAGLIKIVNLMNGLLRTPKIHQFNKLISWITIASNSNINMYGKDTSSVLSNAWLRPIKFQGNFIGRGFIDARL